jgi:hypothetical protein
MTTRGQAVSASPKITKTVKATKYYGWVIRVLSSGVPVCYESNQPGLKLAAEKTPAAFDMAVSNMGK